jgi:hypothetical protein
MAQLFLFRTYDRQKHREEEPTTKPLTAERAMLQDSNIGIVTSGDSFGPPRSKYENLISLAKEVPPVTTVVGNHATRPSCAAPARRQN